jgi:hypothetical protein
MVFPDRFKPHLKRLVLALKKIVSAETSTPPPRPRSAVPPAILDLDGIAKAVSYPPVSLDSLSPRQLDHLSFVGYPELHGYDHIDRLFPKNERFWKLDPPLSYLSSGKRVRAWRKIGRSDQKHVIEEAEAKPLPASRLSSRR